MFFRFDLIVTHCCSCRDFISNSFQFLVDFITNFIALTQKAQCLHFVCCLSERGHMSGKFVTTAICALVLICLMSGVSYATIHSYNFGLDGPQALTDSLGTGTGLVDYDDMSNLLSWDLTWSNLLGNAVLAHFHKGAPKVPGPVELVIPGVTGHSGRVTGSSAITSSQGTDLIAGLWYVNIHSDRGSQGEIRGQVVNDVPEPSTIVLLITAGIVGLFLQRHCVKR
ncbi:MAG TPA: CHRD domain-containing protein [Thermoguttaceae bacterium]